MQVFVTTQNVPDLPEILEGIPVQRKVTGLFLAGSNPTTRERPAPLGYSVGHPAITAGTIGAGAVLAYGVLLAFAGGERLALVTGGAGFIGSHITERLLSEGYRVRILDNFSTGKRENIPQSALVEVINGDVADFKTVQNAMENVAVAFHEAAIASVPQTVGNPLASERVNYRGTLNVLEAARHAGTRRVMFACSAAVYGDLPELPKQENMPLRPLSPYAVDKLASEYACQVYWRLHGLETVCLRYFNAAGAVFEQLTRRDIYDELQAQLAIPLQFEDWDRSAQAKAGDLTVSRYPAYPIWFSTRDMARIADEIGQPERAGFYRDEFDRIAAEIDARRKLAEQINGLMITSNTSVRRKREIPATPPVARTRAISSRATWHSPLATSRFTRLSA